MAIAISPEETFDFVSEEDLAGPASERTVWRLRYFTDLEWARVQSDAVKAQETQAFGDYHLNVLRSGLVGASHFLTPKGVEVPFSTEEKTVFGRKGQVPNSAFLSRIHPKLREQIAGAIVNQKQQELTEDEVKN